MSNYDYLSHHFHRVDSILWLEVKSFIQKLMVCRVQQGADQVLIYLSREMWNDLDEFCVQMECAYLHPRRDSHHIDKSMISYCGHALPGSSRSFASTASPTTKKNLRYRGKGVAL